MNPAGSNPAAALLCSLEGDPTLSSQTGAELSGAHIQVLGRSSDVVLMVVDSKAQQSLVSDSSVQSLPASLLLGPPAERDVVFRERGRW